MFIKSFLIITMVLFLGCTKWFGQSAPDLVVKEFVGVSASAKAEKDKKRLQELCTGEMRRVFERMTDETFRISYLTNSLQVKDLKIIDSMVENDGAKISYSVSVENKQGTDPTFEVNQREVELARVNGRWLIESIKLKGTDQIVFSRGMLF